MSKLRSGALLCLCVAALCARALAIDHLNTLQIGTDNWGNQVMQAGVVQPQYDPANVATSLKRYATDYPCVELYLQMSPPKSPTDPAFLNYGVGSVTTTPPGLLKVQPVVQGEVLRPTDLPELILLEFQCIGNVGGDVLVEFNIRFNVSAPGGMVPVTAPIAFNKTCSNNAFNPYLNVGSTPNKADIITLGVYTNKLRYTAMTPYDLFYAWLDPSAPHNQTLEVGAQGHVFGNQVFLTPNYTLVNGDMLDPAIKADDSLALQINYNCQPVGAPGVTQLSFLTLSLITGNIGEPPFDPVSFVWMHVCPAPPNPTPTPTPHDPSSGLGAGATAAIVIVVLAFAAYAAACGYNYMVRKRRGIEILPGASFCARQSTSTSSYNAVVPASQTNERTPFAAGSSSEL